METTYSETKLNALRRRAERMSVLLHDVNERVREARTEYATALRVRDTGTPYPRQGSYDLERNLPRDEKTQAKAEQACGEAKAKRDELQAESDELSKQWNAAGGLVSRCEEYIEEHHLKAHDKPKAERSRYREEPPKDEDFNVVVA